MEVPSDEKLGKISEDVERRRSSRADDYSVQHTNDEAFECKKSAVALGYYEDPFLESFSMFHPEKPDRKDPEINRGYWARVQAVKDLTKRFIDLCGDESQIVSLGCGFDTLYWRLCANGLKSKLLNFTEVDFCSVTAKKIHVIAKDKDPNHVLRAHLNLSGTDEGYKVVDHTDLHSDVYHLVGADLRQEKELIEKLLSAGLDTSKPTLFIAECVLVYMEAEKSEALLKLLGDTFPTSFFLNYEQVNLSDKFGEIMKENLHERGISLVGMKACSSLEEQQKRFVNAGWTSSSAWTMDFVYTNFLPTEEKNRIEKIEFFDEIELLRQLLQHYCISLAFKDSKGVNLKTIFWDNK